MKKKINKFAVTNALFLSFVCLCLFLNLVMQDRKILLAVRQNIHIIFNSEPVVMRVFFYSSSKYVTCSQSAKLAQICKHHGALAKFIAKTTGSYHTELLIPLLLWTSVKYRSTVPMPKMKLKFCREQCPQMC